MNTVAIRTGVRALQADFAGQVDSIVHFKDA